MKDNLKKGQAFIGIDGNKYYFLGYDYEEQVMFTNLDLWTDVEQQYIVKNNLFIKDILDERSDIIEDCTWFYQSRNEFNNADLDDKVKRCLDNISNANTHELELKPTKIGDLVRGQAYSKEFNQFYEVIGFIIENNLYIDGHIKSNQKGFFSIYHSNCDDRVPMIFERSDSVEEKHFISSNGDKVEIKEILMSKEKINGYLDDKYSDKLEKTYFENRIL